MTTELYYLVWVSLLTTLMWIPYGVHAVTSLGVMVPLGNRDQPITLAPWAERAKRAHANAVENLVVFAALVLAANQAGVTGGVTAWASIVYFWSRLAHYVVYTLGVVGVRSVVWGVAWACQVIVAWQLLTAT